eukprot:TRINITY_DN6686_c0_g1_i5.p1 TRINITY_DN6686_c0_g1~~TRINITY_DN6686_c0_g1_i5.p1  ORF type:complete len:763 (-),score=209.77 TRINITY_DN6686_c0_g1_i5:25-2223(-)
MGGKEVEELEESLKAGSNIERQLLDCITAGMCYSDLSKRREETESALEKTFFTSKITTNNNNNNGNDSALQPPRSAEFKSVMESSCRSLFHSFIEQEWLNCSERGMETDTRTYLLYEASFWLTKRELASGALAILLVTDLFERETVQNAERIFDLFIEKQRDQIVSILSSAKATLLKTCKDLLRRIPKSNYPLLSSKIAIFLCNVLPLTDRSGVNPKSEHNNTSFFLSTNIGVDEENAVLSSGQQQDTIDTEREKTNEMMKEYGKSISKLYDFFVNPNLLYASIDNWNCFIRLIEAVLVTFSSHPINSSSNVVIPTTSSAPESSSAAASSSPLSLPSSSSSAAWFCADVSDDASQLFFLKYSSSPRLLSLLIGDAAYRRQILTQFLIFFQSLLVKTTPKTSKPLYVLSDKQRRRLGDMKKRISTLLEKTKDSTTNTKKRFSDVLLDIHLPREKNWVYWKRDGCKAFEKSPQTTEEQTPLKHSSKRHLEQAPLSAGKRIKKTTLDFEMITRSVKNAASEQQTSATDEKTRKSMIPDLLEYLRPLAEQMDPAAGIEDEYKLSKNKVYEWKALRLISRTKLQYFSKMTHGNNLEHVVKIIQDEQKAKEEQKKTRPNEEVSQETQDGQTKVTEDSSQDNGEKLFDSTTTEDVIEEMEDIVGDGTQGIAPTEEKAEEDRMHIEEEEDADEDAMIQGGDGSEFEETNTTTSFDSTDGQERFDRKEHNDEDSPEGGTEM